MLALYGITRACMAYNTNTLQLNLQKLHARPFTLLCHRQHNMICACNADTCNVQNVHHKEHIRTCTYVSLSSTGSSSSSTPPMKYVPQAAEYQRPYIRAVSFMGTGRRITPKACCFGFLHEFFMVSTGNMFALCPS